MSNAGKVAIIDYGMGNLFSVQQACHYAGLKAVITMKSSVCSQSQALILPGVGAFGNAMQTLKRLNLVSFLRDWVKDGRPFIGICLGMQLLMTRSFEFGEHDGLDIIPGRVVRFRGNQKVPQIGWNRILFDGNKKEIFGLENQTSMYFVHSYYVETEETALPLTISHYGGVVFCSSLHRNNVVAFQFHPERSGPAGLKVYRALAEWIQTF